ncbi:unnamed protein product, partial [Discosporangium mesarthrocarpum]
EDDENDSSKTFPGGAINVYFASQTGTAEGFAQTIASEGLRHGFKMEVVDLEDFDEEQLRNAGKAIFVMATYGEGEPPDNAAAFSGWLANEEGMLSDTHLGSLYYTVFGLGNKQYEQFNHMSKVTDKGLDKLGATRMFARGEGDDDGSLEEDFEAWREGLWPVLTNKFGGALEDLDPANAPVDIPVRARYLTKAEAAVAKPVPESDAASSTKFFWYSKDATIDVNRELRAPGCEGSTRHIEISLDGTGIEYETADNLAVLPENDHEAIEALCKVLGFDPDAFFSLEYDAGHKAIFPTPCTVRLAFRCYLDVMSVPRRSLLEQLVPYVTDEEQRKVLRRLSGKEGRQEYYQVVEAGGRTLADLITSYFPSLSLPLERFVHIVPHLHPRYYTISSSKAVYPTQVHVTVSLLEVMMSEGRVFRGVCTSHLGKLVPQRNGSTLATGLAVNLAEGRGCTCKVFVRPSTFRLPSNPSTPIIMVGPGTGLAPMRALLQERAHMRERGEVVGRNVLYFGCRHREKDYIYRDELEAYEADGTIDSLRLAFSREQARKNYVQHLLAEDAEIVWGMLKEGAYVYVCGGTSMGNDVHKELS